MHTPRQAAYQHSLPVSLSNTCSHSLVQTDSRMHTHTEREWNPPEGSFGTALLNLSPAGKQSVGSERKPVGASSRSPPALVSLFLSHYSLLTSLPSIPHSISILFFFFLLIVAPSSPAQSPSHHSYHCNPPLCATRSSLITISCGPEDSPGRFQPRIH